MSPRIFSASLSFVALAALAASHLQAGEPQTLISDTFALKPGVRDAGAPLNSLETDSGEAAWKASPWMVFGSAGGITSNTSGEDGDGGGAVPVPKGFRTLILEADCEPQGAEWMGLAFLNEASPMSFWESVQVFVILRPDGKYSLFAGGPNSENEVAKGKAPLKDVNHVALKYDEEKNAASLSINGEEVVTDNDLNGVKPLIKCVGFRIHTPSEANAPLMRNFVLKGSE